MEEAYNSSLGDLQNALIDQLSESRNFTYTHTLIKKMSKYSEWTAEQTEKLIDIALQNTQVRFILGDSDLNSFYSELIEKSQNSNSNIIKYNKN